MRSLARAAWLLEHTDLPVTQVALDSGFGDASHFSRAFLARFAQRPTAYRARIQRAD